MRSFAHAQVPGDHLCRPNMAQSGVVGCGRCRLQATLRPVRVINSHWHFILHLSHSFIQCPPINHRLRPPPKKRLKFDEGYRSIFPDVSVKAMPVLHGKNDTLGDYESSAFFIRNDPSGQEFLFFGDVSPDSLTPNPQTIAVWRAAAPKIPSTLSTIFIECSWPSGRPDEQLYGHLSPEHLVDELAALAAEVAAVRSSSGGSGNAKSSSRAEEALPKRKRRRRNKSADVETTPSEPLAGVRIYVMHCKDDLERKYSRPIYHVIRDQVAALVQARGLGAEVLSAEQGMTIGMFAAIC
jgi:cAMP phosphodiesterases class-II